MVRMFRSLALMAVVIGALLMAQAVGLARGESLQLDKDWFRPGEEIRIHFTAPRHFSRDAWIGIIPSHIQHGSEAVNDRHDISYEYIEKRTSGVIILQAPREPGSYDVRMHDTDNNGREVYSVSFNVGGPGAGNHKPGHYVGGPSAGNQKHGHYVGGPNIGPGPGMHAGPPVIAKAPSHSNEHSYKAEDYVGGRYAPESHSIMLDKAVFRTGEEIRVRFTAPRLPNNAWIGIIPSHIKHGSEHLNDQHDISYQYLEGKRTGVLYFVAPESPGEYDFRLHDTDDDNGVEMRSISFRVVR